MHPVLLAKVVNDLELAVIPVRPSGGGGDGFGSSEWMAF